ncbi:MAG: hypothetical protein JNM93_02850 [Bacteriovoracaceae bacterium]|nr:hypothetical protein [Bacteriovoracaceae bacterium]
MRFILLLLVLLFSCRFDEGYKLDFELKDFAYAENQGTGDLKLAYLPEAKSDYLHFELTRRESDFLIQLPGLQYSMKKIPSFFKSLSSLELEQFLFSSNVETSKLSFPRYFHVYKDDSLLLEELEIECHGGELSLELKQRLIQNCFNVMRLNLYRYFDKVDEFEILNLRINIRNQRLNAQGNIYSKLSGSFELKGNVDYLPTSDELSIKVDQVKLGVLSVTKLFLKFAEKNQREGLRVKSPYIYFSLH